jgi:hypothetical protein
MLTEIPKDEVSLPKGTSGDILDGVSRAGVILDNCDKLLVPRTLGLEFVKSRLCHPESERETGAKMSVELDGLPKIGIDIILHERASF